MLQIEKTELVREYVIRVSALSNQMKIIGENVEESILVAKILRTLILKFDPITIAIEETKDLNTMTVNKLLGSLEAYKQWLNEKSVEKLLDKAFQFQASVKDECNIYGHYVSECRSKNHNQLA